LEDQMPVQNANLKKIKRNLKDQLNKEYKIIIWKALMPNQPESNV
jgi:hypothetical protein